MHDETCYPSGGNTTEKVRNYFPVYAVYVSLLLVSFALRLYQFARLTDWWGDPGGDLLVTRNILYYGHRPLVGSFLTVTNFYIPPTYYYLMAVFLWIAKTPLGVAHIFFVLNIVTGVLLSYLACRLIDRTAGIILFFLFTFSNAMILQGRSVYQTYLVQPFFVLSLYLLFRALSKYRILYLIGSLFSLGIAASIYPSPWLMAPYFILTARDYLRHTSFRIFKKYSFIAAIVLTGIVSFPLYVPQLVFELKEGFPTFSVLTKYSGGVPDSIGWIRMYAIYIYQLFNQFFGIESIVKPPYSYILVASVTGIFVLMLMSARRITSALPINRARLYKRAFAFVNVAWLGLSMITVIVFWENAYHRLEIFYPFLFLLCSFCFRLALETRHVWYRLIVFILICVFMTGNISATSAWVNRPDKNDMAETMDVARFIVADANKRNISNHNYGVLYYTPYGYNNYNLPSVLYFLQENSGYPVRFLKAGNDIDRYGINTSAFGVVYLICKYYQDESASDRQCRNQFLQWNNGYSLQEFVTLPLGYLYIFTRR